MIALCAGWLAAHALMAPVAAQVVPEAVVKAEMIRRFPEFVEWPDAVLRGRDDLILCFSPRHPFSAVVDGVARGPRIQGHGVQVRDLKRDGRMEGCHVLYIAPADHHLLKKAKDRPLLTVGDDRDFCELGGIVNFRLVDGRVRFEVNVGQAKNVGLKFDPQFLRLATVLYGGRP